MPRLRGRCFCQHRSRSSFSNTGAIQVTTGGTLSLNAVTTTAGLGTITNNGGSISLYLTLNNAGATFTPSSYGNATIAGDLRGGVIAAGTAGATLGYGAFNRVILEGVTVDGPLTLNSTASISGGILLLDPDGTGSGTLTAVNALTVVGPVTLDSGAIDLDPGAFGSNSNIIVTTSLTLGAGFTLDATDNANNVVLSGGQVANQGSIAVHNQLDITAQSFSNAGILATGTNFVHNSILSHPKSGFTSFNTADGFITNTGTILSGGGDIIFRGAVQGAGTIAISANTTLDGTIELAGGYAQQLFAFEDATSTLKFDAPSGINAVLGFQPGNTIELVGIPASVSFSNTTLSVDSGGTDIAGFVLPGLPDGTPFSATTDASNNTFITELACFAAGTQILTASGEIPVERLQPGDRVLAQSGSGNAALTPITWIGHRTLTPRRHPTPNDIHPIRIAAHAFGPNQPHRDLLLSQDHALYIDGVLIPIRYLVNETTIARQQSETITYFHVELPSHTILLAENLPCESYLDTGNRNAFANAPTAPALHPNFARQIWDTKSCVALVIAGPIVEAAQARLRHQAEAQRKRNIKNSLP